MARTRRQVLAATGGSLSSLLAAGCLSGPDPVPGTDPGSPTTTTTTAGGVTLDRATVLPELVTRTSPDSYGVFGDRGEQWLVAEVAVGDPGAHPPDSFAVAVGGDRYEVTTRVGQGGGWLADFGTAYGEGEDPTAGWLAAKLPKPLDADAPRLTWSAGSYALPDPAVERLATPPTDFRVTFEAPGSVSVGDDVTATATVENVGTVDGTFVAALNRVGPRVDYAPEASARLDVPVGETATREFAHEVDDPAAADGEDPTMKLLLRWRDDGTVRAVSIDPA